MNEIIDFNEENYDEEAAERGLERLLFGKLLDETIDDSLTREYDEEQLDKMMKARERRLSHKTFFGAYLSDPEFVRTLGEPADLTEEEKAEMAALEEAYMKSFEQKDVIDFDFAKRRKMK